MADTELENSLGVLQILSEALTVPRTMDEGLEHITRLTCRLMETEQAVFLFRDEEREELIVRTAVGIDLKPGNCLLVPPRLKNILWRLLNIHHINWVEAGIEDIRFPIIVAPIWVRGTRVGLLATGAAKSSGARPFDTVRQKLFSLIAPFASLVIENTKVHDLLKQHFALNSPELREFNQQSAENSNIATQLTVSAISNPTKVVKILATTFYNELKRAGFNSEHIASAASQLLDCIVKDDEL